jgi:hypothetical protein
MIGYTLPEIRRLLIGLIQARAPDPEHVWSWSAWRRRRQYQARDWALPATRLCTHLSAVAVLSDYETHQNRHRPHRSLRGAAPLKALPEPADLAHYRIRRHARVAGLIHEYRLVA